MNRRRFSISLIICLLGTAVYLFLSRSALQVKSITLITQLGILVLVSYLFWLRGDSLRGRLGVLSIVVVLGSVISIYLESLVIHSLRPLHPVYFLLGSVGYSVEVVLLLLATWWLDRLIPSREGSGGKGGAVNGRSEVKKNASVYKRGDDLVIHPYSTTTAGVGIGTPPFVVLDVNASSESLGGALAQAMQESRTRVPHPMDWADVGKPLLEAAKVRSWSTFVKGALCCSVSDDGENIELIPTINKGPRGGFVHSPDDSVSIPSGSTPEQVGAAVRRALGLSR